MFLTKKGLVKILILVIGYLIVGSGCIAVAMLFTYMEINAELLFVLGIISYVLGVISVFLGRYSEGKGKLINLGNKLVRKELRPAEFIKEYEFLKNSNDLVIKKPSVEVLQLAAIAYNCLNDEENCIATVDEMIDVAKEKKKVYAKLIKSSYLFSYNKKDEAEKIFAETQKLKLDFMSIALVDAILKSDRAMAMGDYKVVEAHSLKMLTQTFPKLDNLGRLVVHHRLGEVYEKLHENEKAISYYQNCVDFGGETAIKASAKSKLEIL